MICAGVGAWSCVTPFLRRSAAEQALSHTQLLTDAVSQIQKLETLAGQIGNATAQWQGIQESATKTADTARELAESMGTEARAFTEFLKKAGDSEKTHLKLEVEKLRRAETEWLQILVRILDHVFALFQAAVQSGQPKLIEQIGIFQNTCCDTARRVGLTPGIAQPGEPFDPELHQLSNGDAAHENAVIAATLAAGYSYQGRLLRRTMVSLQPAA